MSGGHAAASESLLSSVSAKDYYHIADKKTSMTIEPASPAAADPALVRWSRRVDVRLGALQASSFAGIGIYMPFMPPWLAAQGLSDRQIGVTLALGMIIRMLASQPVTAMGDGRWGAARILMMLQGLSAACYLLLAWLPSPGAIMAAMAVIALLAAGIVPLGDHLTTAQVRLRPALDFARIRLWGSLAFLVVSILSGLLISRLGIAIVPFALCLCALVAVAAARFAPEHRAPAAAAERTGAADPNADAKARLLWLAIIGSALVNASHATLYGFGTLHWRSIGLDEATIGVLWALAVVAEIAMFWWFGRRAWSSWSAAVLYLALAGLAAIIRFAAMPLATSLPLIVGLQLLHALSFGAQLMGIMAIVARLAPEGRRALMQGRLSAANACLMGAATLVSGFAYERFGAQAFLGMIPMALAGLVLLLITYRLARPLALDSLSPHALPVGMASPSDGTP